MEASDSAQHAPSYLLVCRECGNGDVVMPFESAEARGKWHAAHKRGTGHDRCWATEDRAKMAFYIAESRAASGTARLTDPGLGGQLAHAAFEAACRADDMTWEEHGDDAKNTTAAVLEALADRLDVANSDTIDAGQLRIIADWVRAAERPA